MATNATSDMLRQKESQTKGQRSVVRKDQLRCSRSLYNWVVYLKILIRENLFHVNKENWDQSAPRNIYKLKNSDKLRSTLLLKKGCRHLLQRRPEEREFVVDSRVSTHGERKRVKLRRDTKRNALKKEYKSITYRWQKDDLYRNSQIAVGWAEDYCRYLDSISTTNISYTTARIERERCQNNLVLGVNDQGPKPGPMNNRADFSQTGSSPARCCKTARRKYEPVHSQTSENPTMSK